MEQRATDTASKADKKPNVVFIVPFGEWEKNPRLQAKTLVGLRCHGKLPQDLTFRLRSEVPSGLDHQVPQAGYLWRRGHSFT